LIKHIRSSSELGKLLKCQLQWAQRTAGIDESILVDVNSKLPQLKEEVWIQTLRKFLALSELGIQVDRLEGIQPKHVNDLSAFPAKVCQMSDSQFTMINRNRMYLCAETIADLLKEIVVNCKSRAMVTKEGKWLWQPRPGKKHRKAWKEALKRLELRKTKRTLSHVIIDDPRRNNKPRRHGIFSHSFDALFFLDFGLAMEQSFKLLLQILAALPFGTRERLHYTIGYRLSEPALSSSVASG
jgi:hypothetical protein